MSKQTQNEFEKAASERQRGGFFWEFLGFLRQNKKWWLLPVLILLLVLGLLIFLASTGLAPFLYTFY